ncbi:nucleoside-diphosphate kinase [Alkaliphilus serpentinus]|uniref:Nucleoside diphosphate kinase n=1 Tax=Alkaliphilus serpentinus TaxID=1482731 RepID=A0A833HN80_9FIRM|nr:nucleoside-diphosphate kinase [Alkaliphilus serpentinus]KAB3529262.1 nucleoside-diphosphate kinase [Alkaliphilus serpentinus]
MEKTLILIKPDGVKRGLVGEILQRFERRDVGITNLRLLTPTIEMIKEHYKEHVGKIFYQELLDYIMEGPIVAFVIEGNNVIKMARTMIGDKDPIKATPGTIRGDYGNSIRRNIIHASDGEASAEREMKIWFN